MNEREKEVFKTDVNLILDTVAKKNGKPEVAKGKLVETLRQTTMRRLVEFPNNRKWRLSTYFINYQMNDLLQEMGFTIIGKGLATYVSRLTYIDPITGKKI